MKTKSDTSAATVIPAWHPNFRDFERLPDVKVVRTAVFVNGVVAAIFVALAGYFAIQEFQIRGLRSQIVEAERQIARDKKPSDERVALFKKFQAEQTKAEDADAFTRSKPEVGVMLLRIATTLPPNLALDSFDLREMGLVLKLTSRGSPEVAAGYATAYLEQLRADQTLSAFDHTQFDFVNQARDPVTSRLSVEFLLRSKSAPATPKKP